MSKRIEIASVSKRFGRVEALRDVSLAVEAGEVVALLGHNGAGKTTLFRIMLGFIRANGGTLSICGEIAGSAAARRAISYLPESVAFPKMLTGREVVELYATLKGAARGDAGKALEQVGLAEAADRRCGTYSKGMRQRLGLAQAIVGQPKVLLLDEPTSGLDPVSRGEFYELIAGLARSGTAVLLSSHGLSELEARAERVAILRKGRLVADGPLAALQKSAGLPTRIRVRSTAGGAADIHQRFGGRRINGASVEIACAGEEKMPVLAALHAAPEPVADIEVMPPTLDEVYRYYSLGSNVEEDRS
ncbi:MAG: ABC transporter ATP-binding protein [Nitratireductor sp.]|nr:ABC transporter ATP-binding protein [Nitratireductor sp.]